MECGDLGKQNLDLVNTDGNLDPVSCNNTNDTLAREFMGHFEGKKFMSPFQTNRAQVKSGDNPQTGFCGVTELIDREIDVPINFSTKLIKMLSKH